MTPRGPTERLAALRRKAEDALAKRSRGTAGRSPLDLGSALEELQTYRIELESQNEELRRAHADISRVRDRYGRLYDFAPFGYATLSREARIEEANLTLAEMLRVPRSRLIGQPLSRFIAEEDQDVYYLYRRRLGASDERVPCELRLQPEGGPACWVALQSSTTEVSGGFRCAVCDIDERKRTEAERDALRKQLWQSQRMEAIGTLAGGVAHDFNNVLTAVLGFAELTLQDMTTNDPHYEHLREVCRSVERAQGIVAQILSVARGSEEQRRPVDLGRLVEAALRLLRASIPPAIDLRARVDPDTGSVLADEGQLHQVVMNLCVNARQAIGERGGVIEVLVEPAGVDPEAAAAESGLPPGTYVRLTVRDSGPGMTPDIRERVFDPYFTTKPVGEGSGLGLAVAHGIVAAHGGRIAVDSEPGRGTTFHVLLPQLAETSPLSEPLTHAAPLSGHEHLLCVDDEPAIVAILEAALTALGYRVSTTTDPKEALERLRADPTGYDLLLTDLSMPQMSGTELLTRALVLRPDLPAVLASGHAAVYEAPVPWRQTTLLCKPFDQQRLALAVRQALDGRPAAPVPGSFGPGVKG